MAPPGSSETRQCKTFFSRPPGTSSYKHMDQQHLPRKLTNRPVQNEPQGVPVTPDLLENDSLQLGPSLPPSRLPHLPNSHPSGKLPLNVPLNQHDIEQRHAG